MDKNIIEDYFAGKCPPEQARAVHDFLESEEGKDYLTENLIPGYWEEAVKQANVDKIFQQDEKQERKLLTIKIAASLILLIATSIAGYYIFNNKKQVVHSVSAVVKIKTIEVPAGKKTNYRLPDGTVVWLNSGTSISFAENFQGAERNIELTGEAYFEVKKDSLRPFRVKAGDIVVTALGTAFNVKSHNKANLEVSLKEGKVKVENKNEKPENAFLLLPGEGVRLKNTGLKKTRVDQLQAYGWKSGILYFNMSSFHEVIENLERWYGVHFDVKFQPDQSWSFTGTYENESLKNVLLSLSKIRDFSYKITYRDNQTTVTITNKKLMK